jgi:choline monooxygenase
MNNRCQISMNDYIEKFLSNCKKPFSEAKLAPQEIYTNPDFFELEKSKIFLKDWFMVGRTGDFKDAGDYLAVNIIDHPIVVIKQDDGELRAFANVCLHRCSKLLHGKGNKKRISCPYHAWSYNKNGQLIGVPYSDQIPNFSREGKQLHEIKCATWHGFVFVSINQDAVHLKERLQDFEKEIEEFDLENFEDLYFEEYEFSCNWKILMENFNESYHLFQTHKDSAESGTPTKLVQTGSSDELSYVVHYTPFAPGSEMPVYNPKVSDTNRGRTIVAGALPNGLMAIQSDTLWWMVLQPVDVNNVNVRWGTSYSRENIAAGTDTREIHEWVRRVNSEDKGSIEAVQQGANFQFDDFGMFHPLEEQVFQFQCYVANKIK